MRAPAAILLLAPVAAVSGVFTAKLNPEAAASFDKYVARAERREKPLLDVSSDTPVLKDLNPTGDNRSEDVPGAYIHHWIGAVRIPNTTVAAVRAVLEKYDAYPQIYAPDLKRASASKISEGAYDVRLITERAENLILHFAFDIRSRVNFRSAGEDTLVDSRSYSIRESAGGKAPYSDLMPEGNDHGILWRLNSYWRLRQDGTSVYAECEVISLSRQPILGTRDLVKDRASGSLAATLQQTVRAVSTLH